MDETTTTDPDRPRVEEPTRAQRWRRAGGWLLRVLNSRFLLTCSMLLVVVCLVALLDIGYRFTRIVAQLHDLHLMQTQMMGHMAGLGAPEALPPEAFEATAEDDAASLAPTDDGVVSEQED
ncbi:MAG: hypothetical protein ACOCXA_00535 [Planctomycetota bacterium]